MYKMSFTLNNTYTMVLRWDGSSNNESMYIGKIIIQFRSLWKQICFTLHMCVWYLDVPCYIRTMTCTLYQIDPFTPLIFELTLPPLHPHLCSIAWYLYKMVAQRMLLTYLNRSFSIIFQFYQMPSTSRNVEIYYVCAHREMSNHLFFS